MTVNPNDIWQAIGYLETEHRRCIAKLHDLRILLAAVDLPKPASGQVCVHCGVSRPCEAALRDHLQNVHGLAA